MKLNIESLIIGIVLAAAMAGGTEGRAQETNRAGARDFSMFKVISDRNIFDPNRRARINSAPQAPRVVDSFALAGTLSYDQGPFAVFDGTSGDYHKVLGVDGKIAGYSVTQISHDSVKLVSGTNEITLKVGMQMKRSPDGKWAASEGSDTSYAFNSGLQSRYGGRTDRRSDYRNYRRAGAVPANGAATEIVVPADPMAPTMDATPVPPELSNMDPNDPVARMMLRRMQETGGAAPPNSNPGNGAPDSSPGTPVNIIAITNGNGAPGVLIIPQGNLPPDENPNPNQ